MRIRLTAIVAVAIGLAATAALAEEGKPRTVASLYKDKSALAGQTVRVEGKVVKVNNGIMGRNFLHLQDGSGDAETNDLTVTSTQTANVGDQVAVSGRVAINRDFGFGYSYPLLVEEASISTRK